MAVVNLQRIADGNLQLAAQERAVAFPSGWTIADVPNGILSGGPNPGQVVGYLQLTAPAPPAPTGDVNPDPSTVVERDPNGGIFGIYFALAPSGLPNSTTSLLKVDGHTIVLAGGSGSGDVTLVNYHFLAPASAKPEMIVGSTFPPTLLTLQGGTPGTVTDPGVVITSNTGFVTIDAPARFYIGNSPWLSNALHVIRPAQQSISGASGNQTLDFDAFGSTQKMTVTGNVTFAAPLNVVDGGEYRLRITQVGGPWTATWNAKFHFGSFSSTLTSVAGAIDLFYFEGGPSGVLYCKGVSKGVQ